MLCLLCCGSRNSVRDTNGVDAALVPFVRELSATSDPAFSFALQSSAPGRGVEGSRGDVGAETALVPAKRLVGRFGTILLGMDEDRWWP